MGELNSTRIQVGVSSCLLGEEVRYNGGHKRSRYITDTLSDYFQYVPLCPELAVGLGVPRPPIRLVGSLDAPRAISPEDATIDATEALDAYARLGAPTPSSVALFSRPNLRVVAWSG
jgi:uncharacterized protein YbbK (DUF523 family)